MGAKSSSRGGRPSLVAIHTNEGPNPADVFPDRTAENLAAYLDRPDVKASYHRIVDDDSDVTYLPEGVAAWALRSGNGRSLNLCFTGWARWDRAEWLRHDAMLRRGAAIVRGWCDRYNIPARKLTSSEVGRDLAGVCGHVNWTEGKRDGDHWDPGPGFPWDVFMAYVAGQEDIMATLDDLRRVLREHAEQNGILAPARRVDVGFARDQLVAQLTALRTAVAELAKAGDQVDPEQLLARIDEQVRAALADAVIDVDIAVTNRATDDETKGADQ